MESSASGAGMDFLLAEAKQSQFFLIGEDHGARETAEFASAIFGALGPLGYKHLAIEAGPLTGARLESIARRDGLPGIETFARKYPFSLPFFMWDEEARYLARVVAGNHASSRRIVWGVDQEFEASPRFHAGRLSALARTPAQKAAVAGMRARVLAGYQRMVNEHNPGADYLMNATPESFQELKRAFEGRAEAEEILAELQESAQIYQLWMHGDGYRSNEMRSASMRRHFRKAYQEAVASGERLPRVMGKFGAAHVMKGLSFSDVHDLGSYLPEIAAFNGMKAFHVVLLAPGGHVNAYFPFSRDLADKMKSYTPAADAPHLDAAPLFAAAIAGEWTVIDLRPARAVLANHRDVPVGDSLRRIIFGFDAVVIIPEVHPATLIE